MQFKSCLIPLAAIIAMTSAAEASAQAMVREQKVISSAGARAMVDACTAWAERNHTILAMSVLDWGGNLIESHAMEGAAANAIDTALLKAKSALPLAPGHFRNQQDRALRPKSGADFHAGFSATRRVADHRRRPGDRRDGRFQRRRRKMRPSRDRRGVQQKQGRAVSRDTPGNKGSNWVLSPAKAGDPAAPDFDWGTAWRADYWMPRFRGA